jgi:hypothetical protein
LVKDQGGLVFRDEALDDFGLEFHPIGIFIIEPVSLVFVHIFFSLIKRGRR